MEEYADIAGRIKDYFERRFSTMKIRSIEFTTKYNFEEPVGKQEVFEIQYWFDHGDEEDGLDGDTVMFWPHCFSSKVSFDNAFEKSKKVLAALIKAQEEDV